VNNAGVFKFEPVEAVTEDEFHREFDTNVLGSILAVQEGLKYFGPAGGSIINVSSVASSNPAPNSVVYSAARRRSTPSPACSRRARRSQYPSQLGQSQRHRDRGATTSASFPASWGSGC
jgi:hypothetical protein